MTIHTDGPRRLLSRRQVSVLIAHLTTALMALWYITLARGKPASNEARSKAKGAHAVPRTR